MTGLPATTDATSPSLGGRLLRHPLSAPFAIAMVGFAISITGIGIPSIWYDEAATIISSTRSWPQLWAEVGNVDAVHALYYAGMHLVFDVFGYSPVTLRIPSAIAVAGAGALTVVLARQLTGTRGALIAGLIFCLLPRTTWMGTEGRSYAVTAALAALLTIVLVHASRSTQKRWWVLYGCLIVVSCLTFIYLALIVIAHAATMVWRLSSARLALPRHARIPNGGAHMSQRWLITSAFAGLALLPFGLAVIGQTGQLFWIDPLGPQTLRQVLRNQWFFESGWFALLGWVLIGIGTIVIVRRSHTKWTGLSPAAALLPALAMPTIVLLVATAVYTPLYTPRYLSMCLPFVAIVIAAAIAVLPTRPIRVLVVLALVCLAVPQIFSQRQPDSKENTSWQQVADLIASERTADGADSTTAIIYGWVRYHPSATTRVIAYSYPVAFRDTIDVTLGTPAFETAQLWETRRVLADSLDRLERADVTYLITSTKRDLRGETATTLATDGWRSTDEWRIADVNVVRYEK